jgi:hypothetical protein
MLGEYLGKTYAEVKSRPRYFIETVVSGPTPGHELVETPHAATSPRS